MEIAIKRFAVWAKVYDNEKFAIKAKSMQKRLDKMDRVEKPITERKRMDLGQLNGWRGSNKVLELANISKSFGEKVVFSKSQRDHLARRARWADRRERRREVCVAADDPWSGNA
jgi:ATP-binding cassette, subfamily F, member 3